MTGDRSNSDEIARIAVRALLDGRADSVDGAIDFAMNCATDFARNSARAIAADGTTAHRLNNRGVVRPSRALLRAHAQAMGAAPCSQPQPGAGTRRRREGLRARFLFQSIDHADAIVREHLRRTTTTS